MDGSSQAEDFDPNSAQTRVAINDQSFLLFFITGTYFGPDIKGETPQKPILQRVAEGLQPYSSDDLVGSHMKTEDIEQVFLYVLRKANNQSAAAVSPMLPQFFQGNIHRHEREEEDDPNFDFPQFPDLFPPALHPHSEPGDGNAIVGNIAFISDPEVYYLDLDDVERFRRLTGLEDFFLDEEAVRLYTSDGSCGGGGGVGGNEPNGELCPFGSSRKSKKTKRIDELLGQPRMVLSPSFPTKTGLELTGSAAEGKLGSSIGLIDIGECDDSYLFRISLPGVKRDARDFSCEVESNGKVVIRGVTSAGEKTVYRYSHKFEMHTQNLSPPGRFSVSFKLPGRVNPQQFSGNFGTDGILEGIVMKDTDMVGR